MVTEVGPALAFLLRLGRFGPVGNIDIEIITKTHGNSIRCMPACIKSIVIEARNWKS